jgi:pimeloyl-ACP methyl ester carboxylesterase
VTVKAQTPAFSRTDFHVASTDGVQVFVREVTSGEPRKGKVAVILVHGARVPGLASFDLEVANGSLAEEIARNGHPVYIMDARGYGQSTRPAALDQPAEQNLPAVRGYEVVRDIEAVVREVKRRNHSDQVALFGWATGGMWSGFYASLHPEEVSHLILLNALYGGSSHHSVLGHGSSFEDPKHPGVFNAKSVGAYAWSDGSSVLAPWDRSIPDKDKTNWRDPKVAEAYREAALASDPAAATHQPPAMRAPTGAIEDSFYQAVGRQLYDASSITANMLIVRAENDFWSRPEDVETLAQHLARAHTVKVLQIPHATHFVHLDRPEHGRDLLISAVRDFLETGRP